MPERDGSPCLWRAGLAGGSTASGPRPRNALFGIVQGGMFEHLRDESLAGLVDIQAPS